MHLRILVLITVSDGAVWRSVACSTSLCCLSRLSFITIVIILCAVTGAVRLLVVILQ